jgi:hypothetical protein
MPDEEDEDSCVDVALLRQTWDAFLTAGGVTANDLARFLNGERISDQPVKRRRHLRLVVSNNPLPRPSERKRQRLQVRKSRRQREREAEEAERQDRSA